MGYETTMYVMHPYGFTDDPPTGQELAVVELCKCGYDSSHVGRLLAKHTHKPTKDSKPPFALYANNPERQYDAVEFLRDEVKEVLPDKAEWIQTLSDDIEDGTIITDKYGAYLGVIEIDDMIAAMEEDQKVEIYRRFTWALALLKSIKDNFDGELKIVTYGH